MASQHKLIELASTIEINRKAPSFEDGLYLSAQYIQNSNDNMIHFLTDGTLIDSVAYPTIGKNPAKISPEKSNYESMLSRDAKKGALKDNDCSNRTLIIVPGYSVSNPPRVGDHRYYIEALKYNRETNPRGYKRIYVFDLYSKKDGRCNFEASLSELADELWQSINTKRDSWHFEKNGDLDFIGASMGGLIVRKFIQQYCKQSNCLTTKIWGKLYVQTILLIGTPNHGCKLVDKLQLPLIQFLLRMIQGKKNFSTSKQVQQISVGNVPLFSLFFKLSRQKRTPENIFLRELNRRELNSDTIRWITLRGTKSNWYGSLLYGFQTPNDGVIEAQRVILEGAENISDRDLSPDLSWDHRDLYKAYSVCQLIKELLVNNRTLKDCKRISQLKKSHKMPKRLKNSSLFRTNKKITVENSIKTP